LYQPLEPATITTQLVPPAAASGWGKAVVVVLRPRRASSRATGGDSMALILTVQGMVAWMRTTKKNLIYQKYDFNVNELQAGRQAGRLLLLYSSG